MPGVSALHVPAFSAAVTHTLHAGQAPCPGQVVLRLALVRNFTLGSHLQQIVPRSSCVASAAAESASASQLSGVQLKCKGRGVPWYWYWATAGGVQSCNEGRIRGGRGGGRTNRMHCWGWGWLAGGCPSADSCVIRTLPLSSEQRNPSTSRTPPAWALAPMFSRGFTGRPEHLEEIKI